MERVALYLLFCVSLLSCTKKGSPLPQASPFRSIEVAQGVQYDPGVAQRIEDFREMTLPLETLFELQEGGKTKPLLASKPLHQENGKIILQLKSGVFFQPHRCFLEGLQIGREFFSEDVIYSLKRAWREMSRTQNPIFFEDELPWSKLSHMNSKGQYAYDISIEAKSRYEVWMEFKKPVVDLEVFLSHPYFSMIPHEVVECEKEAFTHKPIGTGPWIVKNHDPGKNTEYQLFSNYHEPIESYPEFWVKSWMPRPEEGFVSAFEKKDFEAVPVSENILGEVLARSNPDFEITQEAQPWFWWLTFEVSSEELLKIIKLSVNPQRILDRWYYGKQILLSDYFRKKYPSVFDPTQAREVLKKYKKTLNLNLSFEQGFPVWVQKYIEEDLERVGFQVRSNELSSVRENVKVSFHRTSLRNDRSDDVSLWFENHQSSVWKSEISFKNVLWLGQGVQFWLIQDQYKFDFSSPMGWRRFPKKKSKG